MLSLSTKGPLFSSGAESAESPQTSPRARSRKPRVLVVDDIAANRMVLEMFLGRNGFDVTLADGGAQAVALATQHRFDAILMDLHMPLVDGYEAARRIRAAEANGRHTLMFAVTACAGSDVRAKCLDAGMDEHFAKPLNLVSFCRTLSHLLEAHGV